MRIVALVIINSLCFSLYAQLTQPEKAVEILQKKENEEHIKRNWWLNPLDFDWKREEEFQTDVAPDKQQAYIDKRIDDTLRSFLIPLNSYLTLMDEEIKRKEKEESLEKEKTSIERAQEVFENKKKSEKHEEKEKAKKRKKRIKEINKELEILRSRNSGTKRLSPRDPLENKVSLQEIKSFVVLYRGWVGIQDHLDFPIPKNFPYPYSSWFDTLLKINDFDPNRLELMAFLYSIFSKLKNNFKNILNEEIKNIEEEIREYSSSNTVEGYEKKEKLNAILEKRKTLLTKGFSSFYTKYSQALGNAFFKRAEQSGRILSHHLLSQSCVSPHDEQEAKKFLKEQGVKFIFTPRQTDKRPRVEALAKSELLQRQRKDLNTLKTRLSKGIDTIGYWLFKADGFFPMMKNKKQYKGRYEIIEKQLKRLSTLLLEIILEDVEKANSLLEEIENKYKVLWSEKDLEEISPRRLEEWAKMSDEQREEERRRCSLIEFKKIKISLTTLANDMLYNATLLKDSNPDKALDILATYDSAQFSRNQIKQKLNDLEHPTSSTKRKSSPRISKLPKTDLSLISMGIIKMSKKSFTLRQELNQKLEGKKKLSKSEDSVRATINTLRLRKELFDELVPEKKEEEKTETSTVKGKEKEEEEPEPELNKEISEEKKEGEQEFVQEIPTFEGEKLSPRYQILKNCEYNLLLDDIEEEEKKD